MSFAIISVMFFTSLTSVVVADSFPPGVLGTDPMGEDLEYDLNYHTKSETYPSSGWLPAVFTVGLITETGLNAELFLDGPDQSIYDIFGGPYVKSDTLQYQIITMYRPFIVLKSEPWYNHRIDLTESDSVSATISYELGLGVKAFGNSVTFSTGEAKTTITKSYEGWHDNVQDGKTKVIYFMCTFLRVFGSVTYHHDIVHEYDAIALTNIDYENTYAVTYDINEDPLELPVNMHEEYRDDDNPGVADGFYSLAAGRTFGWEESNAYETSWGIDFRLYGQIGKHWYNGIYLDGSIKSVTTTTNTLTVRHTFTPNSAVSNPRGTYFDFFHIIYQNALTTNLHPNWKPSVSITSPTNGGLYSGSITIRASASDNDEVTKVRCKVGSNWLADDYYAPYQWTLNTLNYANGPLQIMCVAYDRFGQYSTYTITITVLNGGGGGGGGCPILSVYNGTKYIEEGLLDIHNIEGIDIVSVHDLTSRPEKVNNRYLLRLTEHPKTISHLDMVEFYGRLPDGLLVSLSLKSAVHSSLGNVKQNLKSSDDVRIDLLGADHNDGISEYIDLEFDAPKEQNFVGFIFVIEGYNYIVK